MKHLAIAVVGKSNITTIYELSKLIQTAGCSIVENRYSTLGKEIFGHYLLCGNWNAIAKLETRLLSFEKKHEVTLIPRRVELQEPESDRLPYNIYLTALDRQGILEEVTGFLTSEEGVEIIEIVGNTYQGHFTKASMMSLTVSISISSSLLISDLRERFIIFCDELNLDATLEPNKP